MGKISWSSQGGLPFLGSNDNTNWPVSLASGGETTGYRLVSQMTCNEGGWSLGNLICIVSSRHQGSGLLSIHLNEGSDRSAVDCDIRLFTATAQSIYSNAWMITYDEPTGVAKLWWYYGDYSNTTMAVIDCRGWTVPSAGAWQTTKPTGTQVWNVVVNGAEKLKTARTISLTGDITGSASFDGSTNASITATVANDSHSHSNSTITSLDASKISSGTLAAARLPSSGVTAGSYGPTANVTGTNGTTINVPQITVDAYGRVTSVTNRAYTSKDTNTTYSLSSFGITASAAELNKLDGCTATTTELNYVDGVTSNIQTQLNGKASSSHSHSYLPLSGGTMNAEAIIQRSGSSTSWVTGRNLALLKTNSSGGSSAYSCLWSCKTINGSWDLGSYTSDILHFSYITDANYNAGKNTQTADIQFKADGTIQANTFSGTATKAAQLATGRTIRTNLGSTSAATFTGGGNITPGVTGTLPVANGGTGATARGGCHTSSGLLYKIGIQAGTGAAPSSGNAGAIYIQYT